MRLWSLHPSYLDPLGLSRCYFEGLGGLKSLLGLQEMHKNHPQLERFKCQENSLGTLELYLLHVHYESLNRDKFWDCELIISNKHYSIDEFKKCKIRVNSIQIEYESDWLLHKMKNRKKVWDVYVDKLEKDIKENSIMLHPIFYKVYGDIESWERIKQF